MSENNETLFKALFADIEDFVVATIDVKKDHSVRNHNRVVDAKFELIETLTEIGRKLDAAE